MIKIKQQVWNCYGISFCPSLNTYYNVKLQRLKWLLRSQQFPAVLLWWINTGPFFQVNNSVMQRFICELLKKWYTPHPFLSVSTRPHHSGNPVLQSEKTPRKTKRANLTLSFYKTAGITQAWYFKSHPSAQNCDPYSPQFHQYFILGDPKFWFSHHVGNISSCLPSIMVILSHIVSF